MDEQTMTAALAEPRSGERKSRKTAAAPAGPKKKPPRRRVSTAKDGEGVARVGRAPNPTRRPSPAGSVPTPARATPPRQPPRPRKAATPPDANPVVKPDDEAAAGRPTPSRQEALQILVERANAGNRYCLDGLRALLNKSPEIWERLGDLARHAQYAWLDLVAGDDRLMFEAVKRYADRMKGELAGPTPTPVERLLAEQAVLTWLASRCAELASADPGPSTLAQIKIRLRRAESAQRRHLASLKTLTELRAHMRRKR